MMNYATVEDLRKRLGTNVFEEVYASEAPDGDEWSGDLNSAEAEIDGAIASRYTLPVTGARTLMLLKDWTLTLAEERAYARAAGASFAEKVKERVALVRSYLSMIREGSFRFPDAAENKTGSVAFASGREPVFGRGNMEGF